MAKKQPRFLSKLFLFADEFSPDLPDLFAGNVIFEFDLIPRNPVSDVDVFGDEEELKIFNELVCYFDKQYKKARVIINYSEEGLLMYALGMTKSKAFKLVSEADYKNLKRTRKAFRFLNYQSNLSGQIKYASTSFNRSLIKPESKQDAKKLKLLSNSFTSSLDQYVEFSKKQLQDSIHELFSAVK